MTVDALSEAIASLRVLADPTRAWGHPPHEGMRTFAEAARRRVVSMRDGERADDKERIRRMRQAWNDNPNERTK